MESGRLESMDTKGRRVAFGYAGSERASALGVEEHGREVVVGALEWEAAGRPSLASSSSATEWVSAATAAAGLEVESSSSSAAAPTTHATAHSAAAEHLHD